MWVFDTTLYQMYPLGMLDCPFDAPAVDDAEGQERERSLHRVRSLIEWAPYLGKLGVGAILLNPVFASDSHGYNTRDLREIDYRLGTNEDFARVVDALHACGVRVILDAVFNHVGRNFWAFRDVRERRWDSPYKDWFNISFDGDTHFGDGFWYEGWEATRTSSSSTYATPRSSTTSSMRCACGSASWAWTDCDWTWPIASTTIS